MTYQTILVNLSNEATAGTLLDVADRLADRHTAHVLGIHVKPRMDMPISVDIQIPLEVAQEFLCEQRRVESRVKMMF